MDIFSEVSKLLKNPLAYLLVSAILPIVVQKGLKMLKTFNTPLGLPKSYLLQVVVIFTSLLIVSHFYQTSFTPRPYLSLTGAQLLTDSQSAGFLLVGIKNNERMAENFVAQKLFLEESLDPTIEPIYKDQKEMSIPVGPNSEFNIEMPFHFKGKSSANFFYIVLQLQYIDAKSKNKYTQPFFAKLFILPASNGLYMPRLKIATKEERYRIESYMKNRNIPILY